MIKGSSATRSSQEGILLFPLAEQKRVIMYTETRCLVFLSLHVLKILVESGILTVAGHDFEYSQFAQTHAVH